MNPFQLTPEEQSRLNEALERYLNPKVLLKTAHVYVTLDQDLSHPLYVVQLDASKRGLLFHVRFRRLSVRVGRGVVVTGE